MRPFIIFKFCFDEGRLKKDAEIVARDERTMTVALQLKLVQSTFLVPQRDGDAHFSLRFVFRRQRQRVSVRLFHFSNFSYDSMQAVVERVS